MAAGGLLVAFLGGWMEVRLPLTWFPMFFGTGAFLEGFVSRGLTSVAAWLIDHRLSTRSQFVSRLIRSLISGRHTGYIGSESMIVEGLQARPSTARNDKNTHPAFPLSVPWTLLYTFHIGKPTCFNTLIP